MYAEGKIPVEDSDLKDLINMINDLSNKIKVIGSKPGPN